MNIFIKIKRPDYESLRSLFVPMRAGVHGGPPPLDSAGRVSCPSVMYYYRTGELPPDRRSGAGEAGPGAVGVLRAGEVDVVEPFVEQCGRESTATSVVEDAHGASMERAE